MGSRTTVDAVVKRKILHCPSRKLNPGRPAGGLVTIPTALKFSSSNNYSLILTDEYLGWGTEFSVLLFPCLAICVRLLNDFCSHFTDTILKYFIIASL